MSELTEAQGAVYNWFLKVIDYKVTDLGTIVPASDLKVVKLAPGESELALEDGLYEFRNNHQEYITGSWERGYIKDHALYTIEVYNAEPLTITILWENGFKYNAISGSNGSAY